MKTMLLLITLISSQALACFSDFDCDWGRSCVGANGFNAGQCSNNNQQQNNYNEPQVQVNKTCDTVYDCKMGEQCLKKNAYAKGICY